MVWWEIFQCCKLSKTRSDLWLFFIRLPALWAGKHTARTHRWEFFSVLSDRSVIKSGGFCSNRLLFDCSCRFLSYQPCDFVIQGRNSFWKPFDSSSGPQALRQPHFNSTAFVCPTRERDFVIELIILPSFLVYLVLSGALIYCRLPGKVFHWICLYFMVL